MRQVWEGQAKMVRGMPRKPRKRCPHCSKCVRKAQEGIYECTNEECEHYGAVWYGEFLE